MVYNKKSKYFTSGRETWEGGRSEIESGPATFDRGQVRVGTRFALKEDAVSYLPAS